MSEESKTIVEKFVKVLDVNKDGRVDFNDVKDVRFWKWILVTILAIISPVLAKALFSWIFTGVLDLETFTDLANYMIGPFIVGVAIKGGFEDYDKKLISAKNELLAKDRLIAEKENTINQLTTANELKKQEIEFLNKYGIQPKEEP